MCNVDQPQLALYKNGNPASVSIPVPNVDYYDECNVVWKYNYTTQKFELYYDNERLQKSIPIKQPDEVMWVGLE